MYLAHDKGIPAPSFEVKGLLVLALGFAAQAFSYPGALLSFTLMALAMSVLFMVTLLRN